MNTRKTLVHVSTQLVEDAILPKAVASTKIAQPAAYCSTSKISDKGRSRSPVMLSNIPLPPTSSMNI